MKDKDSKSWWERVRGKNRTLRGFISARRRYAARVERLAGKQPAKRQYSVPSIAKRIGTPLTALKRVIRGEDEATPALLSRLAKDLEMPVAELMESARSPRGAAGAGAGRHVGEHGSEADPLQVLEHGLITSARAFIELLRNCTEQGQGARPPGRRTKR